MVDVAEIIADAPQEVTCEKCGKKFEFTLHDTSIWLPDGSVRIRCPHCDTKYKIKIELEQVEDKIHED